VFAFFVESGSTQSPSADLQQQKRKKLTVDDVFNNDDEEVAQAKKRKLVPLDYTDEERAAVPPSAAHLAALATAATTSAEEKRKSIKNLIERIPTAKDDLFAFSLDWSMVDSVHILQFALNKLHYFSCSSVCPYVCLLFYLSTVHAFI